VPLKYEKDQEGVLDAKPDGVLVIPVNCQGILEHTVIGNRFKSEFPNSYEAYMRLIYADKLKPGDCHILEDGEQTIALIVVADAEFGKFKDLDGNVCDAFNTAITKLFDETKDIAKYYSGIIKYNNIGKVLMNKAKGPDVTWVIQKD